MIISTNTYNSVPFDYNKHAFGGTEYMASNFIKRILPDMPKLHNYLSVVVPGNTPSLSDMLKSDKQIIMWQHNTPYQFDKEKLEFLSNPEFHNLLKYMIVPSEFHKEETIKFTNCPADKIYVIPNAIDILSYDKGKFNKPKQIKLVNTSSPDRGLDVLLQSLKDVEGNIRVEVYNKFNPDMVANFSADKRVRFYGYTPKATVLEAVESAHIFAYPSTYPETFCISLVEAMSAGCLPVYPDHGALPEVSNGLGSMYKYEDNKQLHIKKFAKQLNKAIKTIQDGEYDPSEQIEYANNTYSWDAIKKDWLVFHELI